MIFSNIQKKCKERGISIRELEKHCSIGNGTIYNWQKSAPAIDKLKAVSDYFGCTVDDLLKPDADSK